MHLNVGLSNEFFYLKIKEGGLQFLNLLETVSLAKVKLYRDIKISADDVLKHITELESSRLNERYLLLMGLGGTVSNDEIENKKKEVDKKRRVSLEGKINGVGQEIFATNPLTNSWLKGDDRYMSCRTYIKAIKLRTNSIETRVSTTRGINTNKTCRLCKEADESVMHILQMCPKTKGMRYKRHHEICNLVAEKLKDKNYEVFQEETYYDNIEGKSLRPDIVATKDGKAFILDVTVVYERTGASFIDAYQKRVVRYQPLIEVVNERHGCHSTVVHGLTVGARGSLFHKHSPIWKKLGLNDLFLYRVAMCSLKFSTKIYAFFIGSVYGKNRINNDPDVMIQEASERGG